MVPIKFITASTIIIYMFIAAVANASNSTSAEDAARIPNGVNAVPHEFPFMVALQARIGERGRFQHVCGGSLLTKRHVITAAHCFNTTYSYSVVLGAHDNTGRENPQHIQILKWHIHPEYKLIVTNAGSASPKGDIAVIILKEDAQFTRDVSVITLPKTDINESGKSCTAIGWGRTSETGPQAKVLQKTQLQIQSPIKCFRHFKSTRLNLGFSCTYGFPSGVCHGDSGGPFVCKDPGSGGTSASPFYLFGVASGTQVPCGGVGKYELFSRVGYSYHLSFVTNITSQKVTDDSGRGEVTKIAAWLIALQCISFLFWLCSN